MVKPQYRNGSALSDAYREVTVAEYKLEQLRLEERRWTNILHQAKDRVEQLEGGQEREKKRNRL